MNVLRSIPEELDGSRESAITNHQPEVDTRDDGSTRKRSLESQEENGRLLKSLKVAYDDCAAMMSPVIFDAEPILSLSGGNEGESLPRAFVSDEEILTNSGFSEDDGEESWIDDLWQKEGGDDDHTLSTSGDLDENSACEPYRQFDFTPRPLDDRAETIYYRSVREALESFDRAERDTEGDRTTYGLQDQETEDSTVSSSQLLPSVPAISMRPRSDNMGYNATRRPLGASRRSLHHPLAAPSSIASPAPCTARQMPLEMALVQHCIEPTVLTLTSFPFRVMCVNQAFTDATGKGHEILGSSFFNLFVNEGDQAPTIATTPTLLGVFNDDIVRVVARSTRADEIVGFDDQEDESVNSDETALFCKIKVQGIMKRSEIGNKNLLSLSRNNGVADLRYFSIKLSPLQIPASSLAAQSVVYFPIPRSIVNARCTQQERPRRLH